MHKISFIFFLFASVLVTIVCFQETPHKKASASLVNE
jgi:hypothetical protein